MKILYENINQYTLNLQMVFPNLLLAFLYDLSVLEVVYAQTERASKTSKLLYFLGTSTRTHHLFPLLFSRQQST